LANPVSVWTSLIEPNLYSRRIGEDSRPADELRDRCRAPVADPLPQFGIGRHLRKHADLDQTAPLHIDDLPHADRPLEDLAMPPEPGGSL
jgi:hypothetical protein